jgi:hypothetical protein
MTSDSVPLRDSQGADSAGNGGVSVVLEPWMRWITVGVRVR